MVSIKLVDIPRAAKKLVVRDSIHFDLKFLVQLTHSIEIRYKTNQTSSVSILFKLGIVRLKLFHELFMFKSQINMYRSN